MECAAADRRPHARFAAWIKSRCLRKKINPSNPLSLSHIVLAREKAGTNRGSLSRRPAKRGTDLAGGGAGGGGGEATGIINRRAGKRDAATRPRKGSMEERRNDFSNKAIIAFDGPNARPPVRH